jgi:predicted N-acetyltransferase YhbS
MDGLSIKQETKKDHQIVCNVIEQAFEGEAFSDQTEHFLVENLRKSPAFIPELSLVAIFEDHIVGHILFTKVFIKDVTNAYPSLSLAPLSVLPDFQKQGVGTALIMKGHEIARKLGYGSIVVLGHENYYPKFGYFKASAFNIFLPFGAPDENNMIIPLYDGSLNGIKGNVEFDKCFFG